MDNRIGISYCRKSIKPKGTYDDKESILYQEKVIEEYCDHNKAEPDPTFSEALKSRGLIRIGNCKIVA